MWLKTGFQIIVVSFCLFGLVRGSCTSYGHSCWGAHGKRSNPPLRKNDDNWKILKIVTDNNDQLKADTSAQLFSDNIGQQNMKTLDFASLASDENQNKISQRFPKKKLLINKYNRAIMDADSNEDFSADSANPNLALHDEFKIPNYRLIRILKKDLFD